MKRIINIQNITVPTDFSKISYTAFDYAKDLAEEYDAKIHVVHVIEKTPPFIPTANMALSEEDIMDSIENQANSKLQKAVEYFKEDTDQEIIPVLRKGIDYEEIISYSEEIKSDLIIIATHGRTGILRTLLGSVAEKIIRYSKIPVLVTTPEEEDA